MASITGAADERVFQIQKWLGLNENPDGDTKLKLGEASEMRNFRVTRDGNLQKRPGTRATLAVEEGYPIDAVWTGYVQGVESAFAICHDTLYSLWNGSEWHTTAIGSVGPTDRPSMFGFSDKLYILTGNAYMVYDGTSLSTVVGYIPLVAVTVPPAGGGELLEQVNKLTAKRRVWLSPDGTATTFTLPEKGLASIDGATLTADGTSVAIASSSTTDGTVTFAQAPAVGMNTIEVTYTASADFRSEINAMHYSETYNGSQDTRVFLYGDGSNKALYSDVTYHGAATAEYFPDLNVVNVGVENTPITGMIRHYGTLAVYKTDGAYSIEYGVITLADTSITAAFYVTPVNRAIGNEAPGQVQLVLNSPVTLFGQDVYEWRNSSYYTSNLTRDERQAKRVSDRVYNTLHHLNTKNCICYDDNYNQEYYICDPGQNRALVWNYAADAWYIYTDFKMYRPFSFRNELYYGGTDGVMYHVSNEYAYDGNEDSTELGAIDCYWESGAMSFGQDYKRKNSAMLWIGIKPEYKASIYVTVATDRSGSFAEKEVKYSLFDFEHVNFADFTFETNDKPQMKRLKIKAKKFVYYKLIMKTNTNDTGVTVTAADMRVRFMGYAK